MFVYNQLGIRVVEPTDLQEIRQMRNDPSTWIFLTDVRLITSAMQERWYTKIAEANDTKYFVVFDENHPFIGLVRCDEIDQVNRSIRIGCDVVPTLRGIGYGGRIYDLMLKYCFHYLNMHRVWLLVLENNEIAIRLYLRKGFREEGRLREAIFRNGRYWDYIVMSIIDHEYERQTTESVL